MVLMASLVSAQIVDRASVLSSKQVRQFDRICSAVATNSGENISVVILGNDDISQLEKLNSEYAAKLNTSESKEWILASIAPDGTVQLSMSKGHNEQLLPDHLVTLSEGTESIYLSGERGRAVEFLLLNICDIIAQNKGMELGQLLSGSELSHENRSSGISVTLILLLLILIGTIVIYRRFIKNEQTETATSPDFGGSVSEGDSEIFGTTSQKK